MSWPFGSSNMGVVGILARPTPSPPAGKALSIQANEEPLCEIDGEAEHGRLDQLIYNTSFPSRHRGGHKGLPPGEHLGQLLSQTCTSRAQ